MFLALLIINNRVSMPTYLPQQIEYLPSYLLPLNLPLVPPCLEHLLKLIILLLQPLLAPVAPVRVVVVHVEEVAEAGEDVAVEVDGQVEGEGVEPVLQHSDRVQG